MYERVDGYLNLIAAGDIPVRYPRAFPVWGGYEYDLGESVGKSKSSKDDTYHHWHLLPEGKVCWVEASDGLLVVIRIDQKVYQY